MSKPLETDIICGFASYNDGSFELIVHRRKDGLEALLTGKLKPGELEIIDQMLPTCVFVPADLRRKEPT